MPTNVGPNTFGDSSLVFAYDTGDQANSYKYNPGANLVPAGVAEGTTSGWQGYGVHTGYGLINHGNGEKDGRPDTVSVTWTDQGAGTQTGDWYPRFNLKNPDGSLVTTNGGEVFYVSWEYKYEGEQFLTSGNPDYNTESFYGNGWKSGVHGSITLVEEVDLPLGWKRRTARIVAGDSGTTQTPMFRFGSGYKRANGGNFTLWLDNIVLTRDYPARQWFPGQTEISSTEGLFDLTGNQTINLANSSFLEDRTTTFDGSGDYFDLGSDQVIKTSGGWTVESIVKYDSVAGGYNNLTSPANFIGSDTISYNSWYWSVLNSKLALWNINPGVWKYGDTILQPNTWYHVVLVGYGNGTKYQFYLNGVAEGGDHTTYSWNSAYSGLRVRYIGASQSSRRYTNGTIPVTKIYNRELTATEIAANFNAFKTRFNF